MVSALMNIVISYNNFELDEIVNQSAQVPVDIQDNPEYIKILIERDILGIINFLLAMLHTDVQINYSRF